MANGTNTKPSTPPSPTPWPKTPPPGFGVSEKRDDESSQKK
jgi:hypothetical protein